ncbi:hypothetical protein V9K67_05825 [Paraflavisolibacter sp. H34]|uniref:hypothetical protein n=1 Tax=Huijunlia imazamoxiresistens TaxID=3127457 RepID=UPI003019D30D
MKQFVLFLLVVCSCSAGFAQTWRNAGKGACNDNHTPLTAGMICSDEVKAGPVLSPTGWGSTESFAFISGGGSPRQLYGTRPNYAFVAGVGLGDARKLVSLMGIANFNDASQPGKSMSYSIVASRSLKRWGSISAGALHLFSDTAVSDGMHSFYFAYSNTFKKLPRLSLDHPRLTFTVGVGSGAFYKRSPADIRQVKSRYGTGLFANLSYELIRRVHLTAEWTGMNLALTGMVRLPEFWPCLFAGVADLTHYSGDRPTCVFGVGKAIGFQQISHALSN